MLYVQTILAWGAGVFGDTGGTNLAGVPVPFGWKTTEVPNVTKSAYSVLMAGIVSAARIISYWDVGNHQRIRLYKNGKC